MPSEKRQPRRGVDTTRSTLLLSFYSRLLSFSFLLSVSSLLACGSTTNSPANSGGKGNAQGGDAQGGSGGSEEVATVGTGPAGMGGMMDTPSECGVPNSANATARAECMAPTGYRNLFSEVLCKSAADVQAKMNGVVQQLFHGTGDQPIYYQLSANASQAYIEDVASGDVRSEGQSY